MKVLIYCQHVLGIGHLVRTLELARAMQGHLVTLVLGGPPVSIPVPPHVRVVRLPALQMDAGFGELSPVDAGLSLAEVKERRAASLRRLVAATRPDILLVELFPFGRNLFSFELLPLLQGIRSGDLPGCRVVCSLRDILVEKREREKYEQRVVHRLNTFFDAVLVHSDPTFIPLDATFTRVSDIAVPVVYTGFVSRRGDPRQGAALRRRLGVGGEQLIVVSAGGGVVGSRLLEAAVQAYDHLGVPAAMAVFTGPYLDDADFGRLRRQQRQRLWVRRFSSHFPGWLQAADLSVSMGGYNTTMDVLAASTPALIYPFRQNREQAMRCDRLREAGTLETLDKEDLAPRELAARIGAVSSRTPPGPVRINLEGARATSDWLAAFIARNTHG
jgi:predicted glycosyltransferase